MKKFVFLAKYTKQGTDGWLDNPDEDRRAMINGLAKKLGGELIDIVYTRGDYDVVALLTAPSAEVCLSLKMAMLKTGAISELSIQEEIDLSAIARKGSEMIGLYKAPGN